MPQDFSCSWGEKQGKVLLCPPTHPHFSYFLKNYILGVLRFYNYVFRFGDLSFVVLGHWLGPFILKFFNSGGILFFIEYIPPFQFLCSLWELLLN